MSWTATSHTARQYLEKHKNILSTGDDNFQQFIACTFVPWAKLQISLTAQLCEWIKRTPPTVHLPMHLAAAPFLQLINMLRFVYNILRQFSEQLAMRMANNEGEINNEEESNHRETLSETFMRQDINDCKENLVNCEDILRKQFTTK